MFKPYLKLFLLPVALMFAILTGCGNLSQVSEPLNNGQGSALLKITAAAGMPFQKLAKKATLTISAGDIITMTKSLTVTDSSVQGTITGIPAGKNRLFSVSVYDSLDTLQYKGAASANVIADSMVKVDIDVVRILGNALINGQIIESDPIISNGLVAWYPFNGNANDASGNGNYGTVNGATLTTDRFGNANSAYSFNGVSNYISVPSSSSLESPVNAITASAWIRVVDWFNWNQQVLFYIILSKSAGCESQYLLDLQGVDSLNFQSISGCAASVTASGNNLFNNYRWFFVSVTYDRNLVKFYVDGQLFSQSARTNQIKVNSAPLEIGKNSYGGSPNSYANGKIDDIRIYNRALSSGEINLLYHEGGWNNTVTDIDGNVYHTLMIGAQTWMVENLKTTKYNDGTAIPLVTGNAAWAALTTPGFCWYNNDSTTNRNTYGALYNWYAVNTGKLAPTGWHVPTDSDWSVLTTVLGGTSAAGGKLKEVGTIHWNAPNSGATNESGFTALAGGSRDYVGPFANIGHDANWWAYSGGVTVNAGSYTIFCDSTFLKRYGKTISVGNYGMNVRCVKN